MSWGAVIGAVVSIAVSQIVRVATQPSQLKLNNDITGDQSETGISSGRYGDPIALQYGSGRITCTLIWAKEIREQVNVSSETQTQGGKGGPDPTVTTTTTTTYTYFGTFAVEICANEIVGISKIWLNSKLFYENRPFLLGTPLAASQDAQQYFTVYNGTSNQIQDPTIVAAIGADRTPGYTNRSIIVFKELPLGEFGNRLPIVEVILHQDGSGSNLGTVQGAPTKLHKVVGDLCLLAGLTEDDIDLTQLTDDVSGYQLSQRGNVQGSLRELQQVYNFGCVDTGKKLKFVSHPVPVEREEYRQNCIINEDFFIVNSYHDVLGRSGYFPSSCGTSEGQFAQIIASCRAYQATSDIYWLNLALNMANALTKIYFSEPPADQNVLYTPHWLFNVKRNVQLQSSVLTAKVLVYRQPDGTYIGAIPPGHGYFGELVTKITRIYGNHDSFLVWNNPYSGVRGTAPYPLPSSVITNENGTFMLWPVDGMPIGTGEICNFAYIVNAGKMLGVTEMMEAWPHWREIEGGEIDCAVDTLAWALDAFDLLYTVTSDSKWLNAVNATKQTIQTVYNVDDGRWWFKKAKGSPFVLSGTYLVTETSFSEAQIIRNNDLQLEFNVSADSGMENITDALTDTEMMMFYLGLFALFGASGGTIFGGEIGFDEVKGAEIQFGRGITDVIKSTDTHIRLRAKTSVPAKAGSVARIFLQDKDDDLLTAKRWFAEISLTTTMTDYTVALADFRMHVYPFNPDNYVSSGLSVGQVIRVAGVMLYAATNCKITIESLRPIPEIALPYTPAIAPYTANSLGGQILDWAGGPGIGYQNPWVWSKIGNATHLSTQLSFLDASQTAYNSLYPGNLGLFIPAYVWDRYDVLEIGGTPGTWQWAWPDPNSEWVGYQARCVEGTARAAFTSAQTSARTIAGNFLNWLNNNWTGTPQYIPTNYTNSLNDRVASTAYPINYLINPAAQPTRVYRSNSQGTTGSGAVTYPTTIGATVVDGGVTWRCAGYRFGGATYGEYNEPHAAALFLRAAAWYRLAGGTTALADSVIMKCWNYMESLVVSSGPMAGTWSPNVSGQEWWGFWGAEIITTLSLLLTDHAAVRTANGISSATINTRIANYKAWVSANTRTISIPKIEDIVTSPDYLVSTTQDIELPNEIIVKYSNIKNSGEGEARYTRKHSGYSDASVNINLNMSLLPNKVTDLTRSILSAMWAERDKYAFEMFSVSAQPMDCYEFDINGDIKRLIFDAVSIDRDFKTTVSASSYDPTAYRISAPAPSEASSNIVTLSYPSLTQVLILNLPALTDDDNQPGYASGAYASGSNWIGGSLQASNDNGASYGLEAIYPAKLTRGVITAGVLGSNTRISVIDRSVTLTLSLNYGEIESITEAQLLNGQNLALYGEEVINFQNATLVSPGVYEINGFLRGQRGTEDKIYGHAIGDQFILLNGAVQRSKIDVSLINVSRKGRAFSAGRPSTDYIDFNFTATGYNLLPWAPVNITANRTTDLVLGWTRRSRITNGWNNNSDIPIGETVEQYRVDLLTNPLYLSGTIITSYFSSVQSITITSANIVAAYGSSGATVHVAIRQMSSIVGAGKPLEGSF